MNHITIRRTSAELPVFDEEVDLEPVCSLSTRSGHVSGFQFGDASLRALDVANISLRHGKVRALRAERVSITGVRIDSVEFTGCKLDYATLDQVRATGPLLFAGCSLREVEFTGCDLNGSLFDDCDLHLTRFGRGNYRGCDLRGNDLSVLTGTQHLKRVIIDRVQTMQLAESLAAELDVTFGDDLPGVQ